MENFEYFILARAVHVLSVVMWIGGVSFVTTVLLPALKKVPDEHKRIELFEQLEGKFAFQARLITLAAGISGFYMLYVLNAWHRYLDVQFWWLHLMTFIWLIFSLMLFVFEPLFLHRWYREQAAKDSAATFAWIHRMHIILLLLSLLATFGAVAGAHGYHF